MVAIDFERHNARVKEVQDAYRARQPVRVPVTIGTNTRYFMLGENAPFPQLGFTPRRRLDRVGEAGTRRIFAIRRKRTSSVLGGQDRMHTER